MTAVQWADYWAGGMVAAKAVTMDERSVVAMDEHWVDEKVALTDSNLVAVSAGMMAVPLAARSVVYSVVGMALMWVVL